MKIFQKVLNEKKVQFRRFTALILFALFAEPEKVGEYKEVKSNDVVNIKDIRLKLGWSKKKPAERLSDAAYKVAKWNVSTFCPQPFPANIITLILYGTSMTTLQTALAVVGINKPTKPQKAAITKASKGLLKNTEQVMTVWQNKADTDPVNAIAIANDGGFDYSFAGIHGARKSGLYKTTEPGVLLGQLSGKGGRQWQSTPDGGVTIVSEDPTTSGVKILKGLKSDVKYGLRGRVVLTKGRYGPWSDWMYEFAP